MNIHTQIVQEALLCIMRHVAPPRERGPMSTYITAAAWQLREKRQQLKRRTGHRREGVLRQLLGLSFAQWCRRTGGCNSTALVVCKGVLLYEVIAAAVKTATLRMRDMIKTAKNEKLGNIARLVGRITPAAIFQQLKDMGLGTRQPKRWKSALPRLRTGDGRQVVGRLALDQAWQAHFGEMEMGTSHYRGIHTEGDFG